MVKEKLNNIITHPDQLKDYFLRISRNQNKYKVGIEFEKLGVLADSGKAISYTGERGIASLLSVLSEQFGWKKIKEGKNIIALSRSNAQITLEPGGQMELSGSTLDNLHQTKEEFENHLQELKSVSGPFDIKWLGLGVQPMSDIEDIEWVPKHRYKIMISHMAQNGTLSHHMMKKTASIQVNVDYTDEEDFIEKMRTALSLVPLTTAIFANSPVSRGKLNGFLSQRAHIWCLTDPARCGLIEKKFLSKPDFASYIDYALHVPMLFIVRGNKWLPVRNITFKEYIENGYQGYAATWDDWEIHLSSIFTEVRARKYIEVRNADSQMLQFSLSLPALWKGILYNREASQAALSLSEHLSWEERCYLYSIVPQKGLRTKVKGITFLELAKELLKIAYTSLKEQAEFNEKNEDESIYLEPLMELIIEDEICPAEIIIKNWEGSWKRRIDKLINYCAY